MGKKNDLLIKYDLIILRVFNSNRLHLYFVLGYPVARPDICNKGVRLGLNRKGNPEVLPQKANRINYAFWYILSVIYHRLFLNSSDRGHSGC